MGSTKADLRAMPKRIRAEFGAMQWWLQRGQPLVPPRMKPMSGLGTGVVELRDDDESGTYRAILLIHLEDAIYVIQVFQKKSTQGIATPKRELTVAKDRIKRAEANYAKRQGRA